VSNLRYRVLFEPRGFIRFLQFILSIVAFATTSGFHEVLQVFFTCGGGKEQLMDFPISYPFRIDETEQAFTACDNVTQKMLRLEGDFSPPAQWFVSVGVFSFLLSMASIVFYVGFESSFRLSHERMVTIADFAVTVLFAFLWLTAAAAWAKGSNDLKSYTSFGMIVKIEDYASECATKDASCRLGAVLQSSKISASVAFGFLNFFLWVSNIWFVYKESPFHPEPSKDISQDAAPAAAAPPQNTM